LLLDRKLVVVAGCHDPLSARISAEAGADALFVSGGTVGKSLFGRNAIPSWGADTYFAYLRFICDSSPVPVIIDGETGFGDPLKACREAVAAGAAGIVIGDSQNDGGGLFAASRLEDVIAQAERSGVVLVPRTDALPVSRSEAADRLKRYRAAGAKLVLVLMNHLLGSKFDGSASATLAEMADAAEGGLAIHCREGEELIGANHLLEQMRAVFITTVSVPRYGENLAKRISDLEADYASAKRRSRSISPVRKVLS
jgi:hypothetical protein